MIYEKKIKSGSLRKHRFSEGQSKEKHRFLQENSYSAALFLTAVAKWTY